MTGALLKGEPGHLGALVLRARAYIQLADLDLAKRHLGEARPCVLVRAEGWALTQNLTLDPYAYLFITLCAVHQPSSLTWTCPSAV